MRKIELEMLEAMESAQDLHWKKDNTEVLSQRENGRHVSRVYLHGNKIAQVERGYPLHVYLTTAGWPTRTTVSRLDAIVSRLLPGSARVNLKGGCVYLSLLRSEEWVTFELDHRVVLLTISKNGVVTINQNSVVTVG